MRHWLDVKGRANERSWLRLISSPLLPSLTLFHCSGTALFVPLLTTALHANATGLRTTGEGLTAPAPLGQPCSFVVLLCPPQGSSSSPFHCALLSYSRSHLSLLLLDPLTLCRSILSPSSSRLSFPTRCFSISSAKTQWVRSPVRSTRSLLTTERVQTPSQTLPLFLRSPRTLKCTSTLAAPPRRPRSPSHVLPTPVTPPTTLLATPPASTASSKPLSALPYVRASFARTRSPKAPNGTTKTDRPALPSLLAARSRRHRKRVRWLSFRREFRCSVRESLGGRRRTTARGGSALRGIMLMPRRWREGMASDTRSIDAWRSSNRTRPGRGRILSLFGR